jgi:hypothetical protein
MPYEGKTLPAISGLTLDDQMPHYHKVPGAKEWYENYGFLVLGEMEDYDFFLWTCAVLLKGPPGGGYWMTEDSVLHETTFFMLPKENRGKMFDNDYISGDHMPWQYLKGGDLKVTRMKDRIIWKIQEREYIARPPYWELRGSHKGVDLDLVLHGICPGSYYLGAFKDIARNLSAGSEQTVQAEGTISVKGKKYQVHNAGGCHENVSLPGLDQVSLVAKGRYLWMVGWSQNLQLRVFYSPGLNRHTGQVIVDGKTILYNGRAEVAVDEREFWGDPRIGFTTCSNWQVNLSSPAGEFEANVSNGGRSFQVNPFKNGYLWRYWNLAVARGSFNLPNGKAISFEDMKMGIERGRSLPVLE